MGILTNSNARIELPEASNMFTVRSMIDYDTNLCGQELLRWLDMRAEVKEYIAELFTRYEALNANIIELSQRLTCLDKMIMYGLNNGELHSCLPDLTYNGSRACINYVDVRCSFAYTQHISGELIITYLPFGDIEENHVVAGDIPAGQINAHVSKEELMSNGIAWVHSNVVHVSPIYQTIYNTYALQPLKFSLLWNQELCTL